jgi:hypothetical protein
MLFAQLLAELLHLQIFRIRSGSFRKGLKSVIECEYIDAPFEVSSRLELHGQA